MLHVDRPTKRVVKKTRTELVINLEAPMDAKGFGWSLSQVINGLRDAGAKMEYDDAYHVEVRDNELVFYFDQEKLKD